MQGDRLEGGVWEEVREGMCLFGLLERDSVFFLWNLDIKLLGSDAAWEEEQVRGAGRAASSLVAMTHPSSTLTPPKFSALPHRLAGNGKGVKTPKPLASSSRTRHGQTPGWEEPWSHVMIRRGEDNSITSNRML